MDCELRGNLWLAKVCLGFRSSGPAPAEGCKTTSVSRRALVFCPPLHAHRDKILGRSKLLYRSVVASNERNWCKLFVLRRRQPCARAPCLAFVYSPFYTFPLCEYIKSLFYYAAEGIKMSRDETIPNCKTCQNFPLLRLTEEGNNTAF